MKAAIITVAGISSRFNEGIPEDKKELKAIFTEQTEKETLLYSDVRAIRDSVAITDVAV